MFNCFTQKIKGQTREKKTRRKLQSPFIWTHKIHCLHSKCFSKFCWVASSLSPGVLWFSLPPKPGNRIYLSARSRDLKKKKPRLLRMVVVWSRPCLSYTPGFTFYERKGLNFRTHNLWKQIATYGWPAFLIAHVRYRRIPVIRAPGYKPPRL